MDEIVSFVKEILMLKTEESIPVGLCAFEHCTKTEKPKKVKSQNKNEMRLSELMDK